MKNTFGNSVKVTIFGESHGEAIGAVIDGLAPGVAVDNDYIARELAKRKPQAKIDTPRQEKDEFQIVSGVFCGKTTGTPICIIIPNQNTKSADYESIRCTPRPGHADYTASEKYHGYEDYRGGGHFSGRITAAVVAAGAILQGTLDNLGISIGTHILSCKESCDRAFLNVEEDVRSLKDKSFPVLNDVEDEMTEVILKARAQNDSVGGVLQTAICGMPAGVGEPFFDSVESLLSHALFSIGGVKGVEFGAGFDFAKMYGSEANDSFAYENGKIVTKTNNNGGINGGITNSMPIIFNCVVKPTPSIAMEQETVNINTKENTTISIKGRHDPSIIRRVAPVINSISAIVMCDLLATRYGTDVFTKGIK